MKKKITTGFVVQDYDDDGNCTGQEFIAGDQVDWEDEDGEPTTAPGAHNYQQMIMVQPRRYEGNDLVINGGQQS